MISSDLIKLYLLPNNQFDTKSLWKDYYQDQWTGHVFTDEAIQTVPPGAKIISSEQRLNSLALLITAGKNYRNHYIHLSLKRDEIKTEDMWILDSNYQRRVETFFSKYLSPIKTPRQYRIFLTLVFTCEANWWFIEKAKTYFPKNLHEALFKAILISSRSAWYVKYPNRSYEIPILAEGEQFSSVRQWIKHVLAKEKMKGAKTKPIKPYNCFYLWDRSDIKKGIRCGDVDILYSHHSRENDPEEKEVIRELLRSFQNKNFFSSLSDYDKTDIIYFLRGLSTFDEKWGTGKYFENLNSSMSLTKKEVKMYSLLGKYIKEYVMPYHSYDVPRLAHNTAFMALAQRGVLNSSPEHLPFIYSSLNHISSFIEEHKPEYANEIKANIKSICLDLENKVKLSI